jgi:molybdate transport system permease protein
VPVFIAAPALLCYVFLALPIISLLIRSPWSDLASQLSGANVEPALRLSLECATAATVLSLIFGVPLAWVFARVQLPGLRLIRAVVLLPLVLPPVVGGVALLLALGRNGIVGEHLLTWFGITLPFSKAAVIISETFVAMPFLIITVEGALRSSDLGLEEAAATLGAGRFTTFRRVTVPLISPSLFAGSLLCWARALGEFGATITFAGNFPGTTQVMPSLVYSALDASLQSAEAVSLVLVAVAVIVLVSLRVHWLRTGPAE